MERQMDQWDLVIKVKHGDTLRRISAYVHGQLMDLDMIKLRSKIISLFKISNDAELILTYTDEDGDIVTLDDAGELRDAVVGQRLNPLRITAQVRSPDSSDARPERSSPSSSENAPQPVILPTVNEQANTIPEPLFGVVSNLVEIAQKTISSSPAFAQKIDDVMKSGPFRSAIESFSKDVKKAISFSPALAQVVEHLANLGSSNAGQTYMDGYAGIMDGGSSSKQSAVKADLSSPSQASFSSQAKVPISGPFGAPLLYDDFSILSEGMKTPSWRRPHIINDRMPLDCCFIQDMPLLDGTVMLPSTHFTKIWRLRNNGNVPWPFGTQLVWVCGDQFGDRVSADLEIPPSGFPVDNELDIAVDFTAPSRPGRYVSYWRMATPSGHKFGPQDWVFIQVDYSPPKYAADSRFYVDLNLNLPPEGNGQHTILHQSMLMDIDVNAVPLDSGFPETNFSGTNEGLVEAVVEDVSSGGLMDHPSNRRWMTNYLWR